LKKLEVENTKLKKMLAAVMLANDSLQAFLEKKPDPGGAPGDDGTPHPKRLVRPRGVSVERLLAGGGDLRLDASRSRRGAVEDLATGGPRQSALWLSPPGGQKRVGLWANLALVETA
jgi:hypothetical protein